MVSDYDTFLQGGRNRRIEIAPVTNLSSKLTSYLCFDRLTGMVALHLAIKIHHPKCIKIDTLVKLSRDQFSERQIAAMEKNLMCTLSWYLHPPTASEFAYSFISLLPGEVTTPLRGEIFEWSKYLTEISVYDSYFVPHRSSSVAFAAVMNVMEDMKLFHESSSLHSFFEREVGCHLLQLIPGSEEVKTLRKRIRETACATPSYSPPAAIDLIY